MNKKIIFVIILFILAPFILISCDLSGYCGIFYGSDEDCPLLYGKPELLIEEQLVKEDGLYFIGELPHISATPTETNYIEKNVIVRNGGNDLLYINQISFYNYKNAFEVIIPPEVDITQPIEEDGEISFVIRFSPVVQGDITTRLDINYTEDGESEISSYNILGETIYPEPLLTLKGTDIEISEYYYENVHIGNPEEAVFILKNTGTYDLNLNSITLLNGVSSYNVSYDTLITSLAPDEEMEITVTFNPIDIGSYQDTLSIDANIVSSLSVLIDGIGVEYNLSLANYIYMDNLDGETAPYDPANIYLVKNNEYVFVVDINNSGRSNITESFKLGLYLIEEGASEVTPMDSLLKEITIDGINSGGYLRIEEPVIIPKELKIDMDKNYKLAAIVDTEGNIPEMMETDNNQIPPQISVYHYDYSFIDQINNLFFIKMFGIIYVDDNDSSDSNIGSPESPMATIEEAINKLLANPDYAIGEIRLFEGVYNISQPINMIEKISIRGGFTRENWNIPPVGTEYRDHPSIIQFESGANTSSGTITQPIATITIGSGITEITKLEGVFIRGKDNEDYSTAVYIDNNTNYYQQFLNCDIISGNGNSMASYGIYYNNSNGVLTNIIVNDSSGMTGNLPGQGSPESYGVYVNSGNITAYGNYINGGYGSDTYGFYLNNNTSKSFLAYNFITGNYNKTASATIDNSYGIYSNSIPNLDIINNVIYGSHRTVSNATHGISNVSTFARILNNTIYTGDGSSLAYGIKNDTGSTVEVRNNIIFGNGIANSYDIYSGVSNIIKHNNSFDFGNIVSTTQIDRNISVDLVDNGGTTYFVSFNVDIIQDNLQLIDDTPLAVRQGGLNLLNTYTTYNYNYDMNLANRTELPVKTLYGWSMGAFENNSTSNSGCICLTLVLSDPNGGSIYPETISAIPNLPYYISATINVSHNWVGWTTSEPTIIDFNSNTNPATFIEFMNADEGDISADITANVNIKQYNLTVQTDGSTGSQISVNGGTPSNTVTEIVDYGALTDISAITPAGWRFDGWSYTGTGVTITDTALENTTVSLTDGDATIQANFVQTYELTVGTDGTTGATTTPSGTITVDQGVATGISATVPTGYNFVEWLIISGSPNISNANSANTTVILDTGNAEIQATYALKQYSLILQTSGPGTVNPSGTITVGHGVETSITATPDSADSAFVGWTIESGSGVTIADPTLESTTITLTNGNATIQANFEPIYAITIDLAGTMINDISMYLTPHGYNDSDSDGDNITLIDSFPCYVTFINNTTVEITIDPVDDFIIWTGDLSSSSNPTYFTITADMSAVANFN